MTRFLNISTDNTLGGLSPSDEFVASQKAIKEYVDNNSSNVQVDNLTITTNASDEIQTVAAINQNSGILKFWKGSKTEYDNLPSHDPDTQYTVTGDNTAGMMPTGSIIPFAGTNIPDGYLLCDGSAISRTTYADLFAAIGTVYGSGDGSTTFNLPNLEDRTPWYNASATVGSESYGDIPNLKGFTALFGTGSNNAYSGPFYNLKNTSGYNHGVPGGQNTNTSDYIFGFDASAVSTCYKTVNSVKPKRTFVGGWLIKY